MTTLLRLRVGSHLYGTARPDSDEDWYEVHDHLPGSRKARQAIDGELDVLTIGLSEFVRQANAGIPQALEAMFAPDHMVQLDMIAALRHAYRAGVEAIVTYARTIDAFETVQPTIKRRRHAVRINHCRNQIIAHGRFDPTDTSWLKDLPEDLRFPTDPQP